MNPSNASSTPIPNSLEYYIRQALKSGRTFTHGQDSYSPALQHGTINRILIYRGCFNPPHKGHLALLNYVFANCWKGMNIILAIILPGDDAGVNRKVKSTESAGQELLKLPKEERVKIWLGHGGLPGYYWVFPGSSGEWKCFEDKLMDRVKGAGFSLEFCDLYGADHTESVSDCYDSRCKNIISSDISRDNEISWDRGMNQMEGYSPWEEVSGDKVGPGDSITTHLAPDSLQLGFGDIQGILRRDRNSLSSTTQAKTVPVPKVWICRLISDPTCMFWFIQKPQGVNLRRVSSSKIRELIYKHSKANSIKAKVPTDVAKLALNADILWEFVKE